MATLPKPIPVRLPQEIEATLRQVAFLTRRTLNAVVIDALSEQFVSLPLPEAESSSRDAQEQIREIEESVSLQLSEVINQAQQLALMLSLLAKVRQTPSSEPLDFEQVFQRFEYAQESRKRSNKAHMTTVKQLHKLIKPT